MSYNLTRIEQETIINYNEAEETANVYTYSGTLKRKLLELCETRPDEAKHIKTNQHGGMDFTVPKKWIKVGPPRTLNITDEERAKKAEHMRNVRLKNQ